MCSAALNKENIQQIVTLELDKVAERLTEHELVLEATPAALLKLGEMGYDPDMGARPLRRIIQQYVEDPLSDALLSGEFKDGDQLLVDLAEGEEIVLKRNKPELTEEVEEAPQQA